MEPEFKSNEQFKLEDLTLFVGEPDKIKKNMQHINVQMIVSKNYEGQIFISILKGDEFKQINITHEYHFAITNNATYDDFKEKVMETKFKEAFGNASAYTTLDQIQKAASRGPSYRPRIREIYPQAPIDNDLAKHLETRWHEIQQFTHTKGNLNTLNSLKVGDRFRYLASINTQLPPTSFAIGRYGGVECPGPTGVWIGKDVLHANYVRLGNRDFICTQAPLPETTELFWEAAMQNTNFIVDLTNLGDRKDGLVPYFPETPESKPFESGSITVKCENQKQIDEHIFLNKYQVKDSSSNPPLEKTVFRFHFKGWEDHGTMTPGQLLTLIEKIQLAHEEIGMEKPPMIHCKAGVGRTGTLTVATVLNDLIDKGEINVDNYRTRIDELVLMGRYQRGIYFVQNGFQYESLYAFAEKRLDISRPNPVPIPKNPLAETQY